ncbi:hypothetical protein D3C76_1563190 [compost metagenome]
MAAGQPTRGRKGAAKRPEQRETSKTLTRPSAWRLASAFQRACNRAASRMAAKRVGVTTTFQSGWGADHTRLYHGSMGAISNWRPLPAILALARAQAAVLRMPMWGMSSSR